MTYAVQKKTQMNSFVCLKCVVLSYSTFLANLMKHIPSWEANSSATSQEIPCILCNPNVHYCILTFYIQLYYIYQESISTICTVSPVQSSTRTFPTHPIS